MKGSQHGVCDTFPSVQTRHNAAREALEGKEERPLGTSRWARLEVGRGLWRYMLLLLLQWFVTRMHVNPLWPAVCGLAGCVGFLSCQVTPCVLSNVTRWLAIVQYYWGCADVVSRCLCLHRFETC